MRLRLSLKVVSERVRFVLVEQNGPFSDEEWSAVGQPHRCIGPRPIEFSVALAAIEGAITCHGARSSLTPLSEGFQLELRMKREEGDLMASLGATPSSTSSSQYDFSGEDLLEVPGLSATSESAPNLGTESMESEVTDPLIEEQIEAQDDAVTEIMQPVLSGDASEAHADDSGEEKTVQICLADGSNPLEPMDAGIEPLPENVRRDIDEIVGYDLPSRDLLQNRPIDQYRVEVREPKKGSDPGVLSEP